MKSMRLTVRSGVEVAVDILHPKIVGNPYYVYLHGFCSVRVSEKSECLRARAEKRDYGFARMDFTGHGESGSSLEEVTLSSFVQETETLLSMLKGDVYVVGSSIGGVVAMKAASSIDNIKALLLVAPAAQLIKRWGELPKSPEGHLIMQSQFVGDVKICGNLLEDAEKNGFHDQPLASSVTIPTLIVHGEKDDVIPVSDAKELYSLIPATTRKRWEVIQGGGHRLNEPFHDIISLFESFLTENKIINS